MFFRYLGISIVKWIVVFFAITVFTGYIAPDFLHGYYLSLPIWVMVTAIAYGFAIWALHTKLPTRRDLILLIVVWMVVTICLQAFYELMALGQIIFLIYSPDIYVQYLLEIVAILLASRMLTRKKMREASGEGLAV